MGDKDEYSDGIEKRIITGMVMDTDYLKAIRHEYKPDYIISDWGKIVARWCVEYFDKFDKAPGKSIAQIFKDKTRDKRFDEDSTELIEMLLIKINNEYEDGEQEKFNTQYLLDRTEVWWKEVKLKNLAEEITYCVEDGNIDEAEKLVEDSKKEMILVTDNKEIEPLIDKEAISNAIDGREKDELFSMPGALGQFLGPFERESFISIQAPEKRGKSWWLMEFAMRALRSRLNVIIFEAGDMGQRHTIRRMMSYATRASQRGEQTIKVPVLDCKENQTDDCEFEERTCDTGVVESRHGESNLMSFEKAEKEGYVPCTECRRSEKKKKHYKGAYWHKMRTIPALTTKLALEASRRLLGSSKSRLVLSCHPNGTLNVGQMEAILDKRERQDGFVPDVVCIPEGSLVLTKKRGLVTIEDINKDDLLWDGHSWVSHDGIIYKGKQEVIEYAGIKATPRHLFWTREGGWRSLELCKELGLSIAQTECNGQNLRIGENYISDDEGAGKKKNQKRTKAIRSLCSYTMHPMWKRKMDIIWEFAARYYEGLSHMPATEKIPLMALPTNGKCARQMHEFKIFSLETLWGERDQIQISECIRRLLVDTETFRHPERYKAGIRPNRQRWPLRARKFEMVHPSTELLAHKKTNDKSKDFSISAIVSICKIFRRNIKKIFKKDVPKRNHNEMEEKTIQKERVWDIRNAGRFHCFTVQGVLAHNCIDYADILAPEDGGYSDFRHRVNETWGALRRLAQIKRCLVMTATQADADSYNRRTISEKNYSEDKRKSGHITMTITLNQLPDEKADGLMRIGKIFVREDLFDSRKTVNVIECKAMGRPYLGSFF